MYYAKPNSQYNVAQPDSLAIKIATWQRMRMYKRFLDVMKISEFDTLIDVGVTSDQTYSSSNYLEAWYPHKSQITAVGLDDAAFLETLYPGVKFISANGLDLPFQDRAFDFVHCSAVLEHVGSSENQERLIRECARVAKKGFFLTTPNRWFPIEFHTLLPMIHWLPKQIYRKFLAIAGYSFFADEKNLNLMTAKNLIHISQDPVIKNEFSIQIETVSLLGWPSNLLIFGLRK